MNKSSLKHAALAAVALGLALSACSFEEQPAKVKARGEDRAMTTKNHGSNTSTSEDTTTNLGDTVIVGEWEVKVTDFQENGNAAIAKANMFNEKPRGQFVLVTYAATYTGTERTADAAWDLTWTLTTSDQKIHEPAAVVTPADNQEWPTTTRHGGTAKSQVTFDVKPPLLKNAILSVEGYDSSFNTIYADFAL